MRKRNYMIGALVGAVGALAFTGTASAAVQDQLYQATASSIKQDKKKFGPVTFTNVVDTVYDGITAPPGGAGCAPPAVVTNACKWFPPANRTVLDFDRDFKFTPGKLPQCNSSLLTGKDTAGAKGACPAKSVVGQGSSIIHTLTEAGTPAGNPGSLNGVVTAFNGVKSGGNAVILLHVDIIGSTTSPILTGTLSKSPVAGFGSRLDVSVPVTPGTVIDYFDTTVNKVVSQQTKANKKKGKKATKTYYASAKCSDGSWGHQETTTFTDGATKTSQSTQACKPKKAPKKKK